MRPVPHRHVHESSVFAFTYGPTDGIDGDGTFTQVRNVYAEMLLERASITKHNLHQSNANFQTGFLDSFGQIQRGDYGRNGSNTREPYPDRYPDLNFLIESHG
jgi:hypothetical protein